MTASLSQGEATAMVIKAARGFGLSWGLAEEAGWALCQLGQFGDDPLSWFDRAFNESSENCPIMIGTTVMDHAPLAGSLAQKGGDMGHIRMPILLIPFLRKSAQRVGHRLFLCEIISGLRVDVSDDLGKHIEQLSSIFAGHVVIEVGAQLNSFQPLRPKSYRFQTSKDILARLDKLGSRTYVPETEASRMSGAGAGTSDND
ncbi:MAG: DUF3726 domain-containing protein [Paracoccaceae bacterium]